MLGVTVYNMDSELKKKTKKNIYFAKSEYVAFAYDISATLELKSVSMWLIIIYNNARVKKSLSKTNEICEWKENSGGKLTSNHLEKSV